MIELEIDGQKLKVPQGTTIIEAADQAGIYIPRFCYHKKLSVAANCRMCLVEVEGSKKTLAACATPATDAMVVRTKSAAASKSQRHVMEFLLINHPLDCPICDQGGECELQDLSMGYGGGYSHYDQNKRAVVDEDLGPLIATEMTRCILCTRCVRFGEEIAGLPELGVTERSDQAQIGTYAKHFMQSELSGNVVDLCPVGALTSKPYRFQARSWEMKAHPSIATHDCLGSHTYIHTRHCDDRPSREVMRVVPRDCELINENWLSDRDRFSYQAWQHDNRLLEPQMKVNGRWQCVDWPTVMEAIQKKLLPILNAGGQLGAALSSSSTVEEGYLMQQCVRGLGSPWIDFRLQQADLSAQGLPLDRPAMSITMEDVENLEWCLLVGSNMSLQQPLLAHRLRNVFEDGCEIHSFEVYRYHYHFKTTSRLMVEGLNLLEPCLGLLSALLENHPSPTWQARLGEWLPSVEASYRQLAQSMNAQNQKAIFIGEDAINHPQWSLIHLALQAIAEISGVSLNYLTHGANSLGLTLAGAHPHYLPGGKSVEHPVEGSLWNSSCQAFILHGVEVERDCVDAYHALDALKAAECVIAMTPYANEAMLDYADFILPTTPSCEMHGTLVNAMGQWQRFKPASVAHGQAKPAWKILRVLAHFLDVEGCDFDDTHEIIEKCQIKAPLTPHAPAKDMIASTLDWPEGLRRYGAWPSYSTDATCRHAKALQDKQAIQIPPAAHLHPETAKAHQVDAGDMLRLKQGDQELDMVCMVSDRVAPNTVYLPSGCRYSAGFGNGFGPIHIEKGAE